MAKKKKQLIVRISLIVVVLPIVLLLTMTTVIKFSVKAARDIPFMQLVGFNISGVYQYAWCGMVGCDADTPDWLEYDVFADDLVLDTLVSLDIDEWGRVYVAESERQNRGAEDNRSHPYWLMDDLASKTIEDRARYYEKAIAEGNLEAGHFTSANDRVALIEDTDGDGIADRRTELATWNEAVSGLVAGVEAREGTLWVTVVPSVHRLTDEDGDDLPETDTELVRGFGVKTSLMGHDLHGLAWGPDGKLYFSMGDRGYSLTLDDGRTLAPTLGPGRGAVFRMNPDGSELEVFATGVRNPQELAFDDFGNLFTGDNNGDGGDAARIVYLVEGSETGWAMPYQSLAGDYVRGPWVAEKLWELQHDTQPAWVLPPVAYLAAGPSGFVHYPGLGLPERYANHFFLCDYRYQPGASGIWSFALEPKGAGFEMVDEHHFAWGFLATDVDFSWDGRIFASTFDQVVGKQSIAVMQSPELREDPLVVELQQWATQKMADLETEELLGLLSFPDQRLRLRAQYELANRDEIEPTVAVARDAEAPLIARIHALWALGQIGEEGIRALAPEGLGWAGAEDDEYRAQLARVLGDTGARQFKPDLQSWIGDPAPRVRFFAAQSLGALADSDSLDELFSLIRENADEDVFLRHSAVWALSRIGDTDAVWAQRDSASRSIRLAALLVLRLAGDDRVAHFLSDADPLLVVEAARAIYDWPIPGGMPELAALSAKLQPATAEDTQTSQALHRRVIGANVRLRSGEGAEALARYAADASQLETLRLMALEALGTYTTPPLRDLTMGFYRPLDAAPSELLTEVLRKYGSVLAADSFLSARFLEIASSVGELPLKLAQLFEIANDENAGVETRAAAIRAISRVEANAEERNSVIELARRDLEAAQPELRMAARELLLSLDHGEGIDVLLVATEASNSAAERKHAWLTVGAIDEPRVVSAIAAALERWSSGELGQAEALEVLQAAQAQSSVDVASSATRALAGDPKAPTKSRSWALAGGDAENGEVVFQTNGDCQRCHGGGGGHGGGVGPLLNGVNARGAEYVLESMIDPQAEIAVGYGSVTVTRGDGSVVTGVLLEESTDEVVVEVGEGDPIRIRRVDIAEMTPPMSGMPPMGLTLSPSALRDVISYVMGLP